VTWLRRHAGPLLVIYVVVLAVVLFSPSNRVQTQSVDWGVDVLRDFGVPSSFRPWQWVEFAENIAIIAPVTFLGSLLRPRYTWLEWTGLGFIGATLVEAFQAFVLPGRVATFSDVVANTLGALAGAAVVRLLRR